MRECGLLARTQQAAFGGPSKRADSQMRSGESDGSESDLFAIGSTKISQLAPISCANSAEFNRAQEQQRYSIALPLVSGMKTQNMAASRNAAAASESAAG